MLNWLSLRIYKIKYTMTKIKYLSIRKLIDENSVYGQVVNIKHPASCTTFNETSICLLIINFRSVDSIYFRAICRSIIREFKLN